MEPVGETILSSISGSDLRVDLSEADYGGNDAVRCLKLASATECNRVGSCPYCGSKIYTVEYQEEKVVVCGGCYVWAFEDSFKAMNARSLAGSSSQQRRLSEVFNRNSDK